MDHIAAMFLPELAYQCRLLGSCRPAQLFSRIHAIRDDLWTPLACRLAFLTKPAAVRSDLTGRQRFDYRRQYLHQSCGEAAVLPIEMATSCFLAGSRQPEHLSRRHRAG